MRDLTSHATDSWLLVMRLCVMRRIWCASCASQQSSRGGDATSDGRGGSGDGGATNLGYSAGTCTIVAVWHCTRVRLQTAASLHSLVLYQWVMWPALLGCTCTRLSSFATATGCAPPASIHCPQFHPCRHLAPVKG